MRTIEAAANRTERPPDKGPITRAPPKAPDNHRATGDPAVAPVGTRPAAGTVISTEPEPTYHRRVEQGK
jgi:hypothetical protein